MATPTMRYRRKPGAFPLLCVLVAGDAFKFERIVLLVIEWVTFLRRQ
jgi:hypothetical protein